ncbi:uncharacterized protein LOC120670750 [Panicum virgatum]|nr:uncharacterized protein LOC120670750 [Panicum virgatum]
MQAHGMVQPQPPPRKGRPAPPPPTRPLPDMEQRPSGSHGGTSSGVRPPLPTAGNPAKSRRRTFVAPALLPTANPCNSVLPRRQEVPNSSLPLRQEVLHSGLPRRQEVLFPGGAPRHDPLTVTFTELASPPPGATTCWDTRSTSSSPAMMGYEAAGTSEPMFDWTPDCSANDPPYYTNLMTQDEDGNLELSVQPDVTPSSCGKGASKWGSNYSQEEDIQLCKSWISISNDAITGTDQSGKTYWERIAAHFHNFRGFHELLCQVPWKCICDPTLRNKQKFSTNKPSRTEIASQNQDKNDRKQSRCIIGKMQYLLFFIADV